MLSAARRFLPFSSARTFSTTRASASDVAKLILVGRLGRDPEVRTTRNDKEYVAYTVATTNYPPQPPNPDGTRPPSETSWHNIYSFSSSANAYLRTLTRGSHVYVEANYEIRETESPEEEGKRSKQVFLRHENIRVLARGRTEEESSL
ncbi:single-strand binding protein family-domain-containing protein [Vararia minispora EC-137]|uniref:Single-strand binding protein family-domain-containing protein n=1 Tax=Vararia minispora EC-137 TaxID=1314806 RepID=A0ACB8QK68_9AGAM|nr:single-strand binding protein family-domain-containing protein [Vararia minispora EC-137]